MGLDTTHDCWHASYGTFRNWRNALARADKRTMIKTDGRVDYDIPWDIIPVTPNGVVDGDWPEGQPHDVLDVLLYHSDCEGIIPWRFTEPLAHRLAVMVPSIDKAWRDLTLDFVTGLLRANLKHEDVEFH